MTAPPVTDDALGPLLRRLRRGSSLTLKELAQTSGVSTRSISNMEHGSSLGPQQRTIECIADGLGLTSSDLASLLPAARSGRKRTWR